MNKEDNIEFNKITEITIDYLINKRIYERFLNSKKGIIQDYYTKDKIFYKKRILNQNSRKFW